MRVIGSVFAEKFHLIDLNLQKQIRRGKFFEVSLFRSHTLISHPLTSFSLSLKKRTAKPPSY